MTVRLARITYERHHRVWRLRHDADAIGAGDKVGDLVGFGGDPRRPEDEVKVAMHLAGWVSPFGRRLAGRGAVP